MAEFRATLNPLAEARIPVESLQAADQDRRTARFRRARRALHGGLRPSRPLRRREPQAPVHGRQRRGHQRSQGPPRQAPQVPGPAERPGPRGPGLGQGRLAARHAPRQPGQRRFFDHDLGIPRRAEDQPVHRRPEDLRR